MPGEIASAQSGFVGAYKGKASRPGMHHLPLPIQRQVDSDPPLERFVADPMPELRRGARPSQIQPASEGRQSLDVSAILPEIRQYRHAVAQRQESSHRAPLNGPTSFLDLET